MGVEVGEEAVCGVVTHILTSLFRANENGCRVPRGKNRERGGSKKTRTRGLKEGGDGEERVR